VFAPLKKPPFPFKLSPDDITAIDKDVPGVLRGMECLKMAMGDQWPEKGHVRHHQYEEVETALRNARLLIIRKY
jgi:hypothetical protein